MPQLLALERFVELTRDVEIVMSRDVELLCFAGAIAQIESLFRVFARQVCFGSVAIDGSEIRISRGEIRIERDGLLEQGNRFRVALRLPDFDAEAVGLQRVERWGCDVLDRSIEFLDGTERFPELAAHLGSNFAERIEHVVFAVSVAPGAGQRVPGRAIQRVENDVVMASHLRDRACQYGFA